MSMRVGGHKCSALEKRWAEALCGWWVGVCEGTGTGGGGGGAGGSGCGMRVVCRAEQVWSRDIYQVSDRHASLPTHTRNASPPAMLCRCCASAAVPQYGKIWEFLRSELEMDGRFKTLESKLNLIQDNLKVSVCGGWWGWGHGWWMEQWGGPEGLSRRVACACAPPLHTHAHTLRPDPCLAPSTAPPLAAAACSTFWRSCRTARATPWSGSSSC